MAMLVYRRVTFSHLLGFKKADFQRRLLLVSGRVGPNWLIFAQNPGRVPLMPSLGMVGVVI